MSWAKLQRIKKLVAQFRSSLTYRPFVNAVDQARVVAFLNEVGDTLLVRDGESRKLKSPPPTMFESEEVTEEEWQRRRELSLPLLDETRKRLS